MDEDDRLQTEFKCDSCGENVTTEDNNPPFDAPTAMENRGSPLSSKEVVV